MTMTNTCEHCKFFYADPPAGECRAHAPTVLTWITPPDGPGKVPGQTTIGAFPPTRPTNWCGEFTPRLSLPH